MGKDIVVTALLGIVLAVALFQAAQITSLSGKLGDVSTAVKSVRIPAAGAPVQAANPAAPASNVQAPSNIANLPSQVGGC